ncbi:MAG: hypothetical protein EXS01_02465 [Phycisphaerales bacterium]|nr:hypothetical protein [Phycisphaerales bacterium]
MRTRPLRSIAIACAMPGVFLLVVLLVLPAIFLVLEAGRSPPDYGEAGIADSLSLCVKSLVWTFGLGITAALVGWVPGRVLRNRGWILKSLVLAAGLIPSYALFFCWWRLLRPGNALADFAITHGLTAQLRQTVLAIVLITWCWPLAAWIISLRRSASERVTRLMLTLDGAARFDQLRAAWRGDRAVIGLAAVAIALVLMGESTAFDAAQVATMSSELRALDAAGGSVRTVLVSAIPTIAIALSVSVAVALLVVSAAHTERDVDVTEAGRAQPHRGGAVIILLLLLLVLVPIVALADEVARNHAARTFGALHFRGAVSSLLAASMAGIAGAIIAVAGAALVIAGSRVLLGLMLMTALVALAAPATLVALATAAFWRTVPLLHGAYDSPIIISSAEAGRFSAVSLAVGIWCGTTLPLGEREAWMVHGRSFKDFLRMGVPIFLCAILGGMLITTLLAATETAVASRLEPPGFDFLAGSLLNAIHYQDAPAVSAAIPWMAAIGLIVSVIVVVIVSFWQDRFLRVASHFGWLVAALVLTQTAVACDRADPRQLVDHGVNQDTPRLPTDLQIGRVGRTEGRFEKPRAMAVEAATGCLFVADKSGRISRFARDGSFEIAWQMPKCDNGKPTGMTVGPDGLLYIADTHEHQVLVFERDGMVVKAIGSYGQGEGQFVYPTDVAFAPDGRIFVSEYGGNDRIQVFDATGRFLSQFGQPGQANGCFSRPQSIHFSPDGSELFVADSCNHRIQVFGLDGSFKRSFGTAGVIPGCLAYPYGIDVLADESLLVAEFGNCRLQRLAPTDGRSLGVWGSGGESTGRLNAPWAVEHLGDRLFVLDTGNARIQSMSLTAIVGGSLTPPR